MTEYVERVLGVPTFLLNGESFEDFASANVDAGLLSPLSHMQLLDEQISAIELIAAPLMQGADEADILPGLVDIVVHRESAVHAKSDLEDCKWAYYARTQMEDPVACAQNMLSIAFHETIEATSPAQALRMILDGRADATAIDTRLFALVRRNSPHMDERLRTLNTCCHTPGPLVVIAEHVHPLLKQQIQTALTNMHKHPLFRQQLRERHIERFVAITNDYYQTIRAHDREQKTIVTLPEPQISLCVPARI